MSRDHGTVFPSQGAGSSAVVLLDESSEDESLLKRNIYKPTANNDNIIFMQISKITTLMEQLHQLEECLSPVVSHVDFNSLKLAEEMAISINKEWRYVVPGAKTVNCYTQRLELAKAQLQQAQEVNSTALELLTGQLDFRTTQFASTLQFFIDSLSEAFALEKDDRIWLFRKLTAYRPWHGMLNQLAVNLFGYEGVHYPDEYILRIRESKLKAINSFLDEQLRTPLIELRKQYKTLSEAATLELETVEQKLDVMLCSLNVVQRLGVTRTFALSSPTSVMSVYRFFQTVHALSLRGLPASEGVTIESAPAISSFTEDGP